MGLRDLQLSCHKNKKIDQPLIGLIDPVSLQFFFAERTRVQALLVKKFVTHDNFPVVEPNAIVVAMGCCMCSFSHFLRDSAQRLGNQFVA